MRVDTARAVYTATPSGNKTVIIFFKSALFTDCRRIYSKTKIPARLSIPLFNKHLMRINRYVKIKTLYDKILLIYI